MTNKEKYRLLCEHEVTISIFNQDWYLDSVCGKDNWDVIIVERGNKIVASYTYYMKQNRFGFDRIIMPVLTQNMGLWLANDDAKYSNQLSNQKKYINELISKLPKFDYLIQNFHYSITNWLPFYWAGFSQTTRYTYIIEDISNLDNVLNDVTPSYRNKIKKANSIVSVRQDLNIEDFYLVNKKTFDRQGLQVPYTMDFIKRHDEILSNRACRKIFYAIDHDGKIHSVLYLIWDKISAYVHMVGEDELLRNSGAGILLIYEAIKYTKEVIGLNRFDFEGSMIESVEQVRRSFGAKQVPYFTISKINSKLYKLQQFIREMLK